MKAGDRLELCTFFEELPVKSRGEVISADERGVEIELPKDSLLLKAVSRTKELFYVDGESVYRADVIYVSGNLVSTTVFQRTADSRFRRTFVRVSVSTTSPIFAQVAGKTYRVLDISETGIGVLADRNLLPIGEKVEVSVHVNLRRDVYSFTAPGLVVRAEFANGKQKIGIKFEEIGEKEKDLIARYVAERQREILSALQN